MSPPRAPVPAVPVAVPTALVVGLGNPLAGDDGVGVRLVEQLARDPRLPPGVEVRGGGADVLRLAPWLAGRDRVLLVDACLGVLPGTVALVSHEDARRLGSSRPHAHHLSPVDGIELLLHATPTLPRDAVRWALVGITDVRQGEALSPALSGALPAIVDRLVAALAPR